GEERVRAPVRRSAAAQEAQPSLRRADLVPRAGGNQDRVAGHDAGALTVDLHLSGALEDEVDLLALGVVVAVCRLSGPERRLGEALVRGRSRYEPEQLPDGRAVGSDERLGRLQRTDLHGTNRTIATWIRGRFRGTGMSPPTCSPRSRSASSSEPGRMPARPSGSRSRAPMSPA